MSYHHGNLHESLLRHGDDELREQGFQSLSLREIARRAGVSHNAPYRHFRDKDDLIDQLLERALQTLADQILSAELLYQGDLLSQLQFTGRLFAQITVREPHKAHLLFTGVSHSSSNATRLRAAHKLVQMNLRSLIENALYSRYANEEKCAAVACSLAWQLTAAYRGLATMVASQIELLKPDASHMTADASTSPDEEEIYADFDLITQNLLQSHWA